MHWLVLIGRVDFCIKDAWIVKTVILWPCVHFTLFGNTQQFDVRLLELFMKRVFVLKVIQYKLREIIDLLCTGTSLRNTVQ